MDKVTALGTAQAEKDLLARVYLNRKGVVTRAAFSSAIYQGDKGILTGQPARAALVIPSRIFGFCGGSHQLAAAMALEHAWRAQLPPNALVLRSVVQAAEILQNTSRWFYTTFGPDLANPAFSDKPLFAEASRRFTAFKGDSFRPGIMAGMHPMALYALFAGHWPHSNFILPGGVSGSVQPKELTRAFSLLDQYCREWLEPVWLGCSLERYLEIEDWDSLMAWLDEKGAHYNSDFGLFVRVAMEYGLDELGQVASQLLSYGAFCNKSGYLSVTPDNHLQSVQLPGAYFDGEVLHPFNHQWLTESLRDNKEAHQFGYQGEAVEVGPIARMLIKGRHQQQRNGKHPSLFSNVFGQKGASVFTRAWARMHEACVLLNMMRLWLSELQIGAPCSSDVKEQDGWGLGLTEAPRGALAHFVQLEGGRIRNYTILPPTLLNLQGGEAMSNSSPMANALKETEIKDLNNPIEVGLIARSFDSCLSCNVKLYKNRSEKKIGQARV